MKNYDKSLVLQISAVFGTLYHVDCQSAFSNGSLTNHFFHSLHYQKYISYEAPLFLMFKFDVDFRIEVKNVEKVFCFLDNWIWIGCGKFLLLQTKYLSSAVNVLANSPKLLDITKRNIFQPSFPQSN